jgi:hypothetical protein
VLIKAKTLVGYRLDSLDGEIGKVKEFYFDDRHWTIRYLIAETGSWLSDRQVLISPFALIGMNKEERNIAIDLVKKRIEKSPPLDSDKPVSRQFEQAYYGYYGYPTYWSGPCNWGPSPYPTREREKWKEYTQGKNGWNLHLRSTNDATGHHIHALDGELGHVENFIIDDGTWEIRYLVINTRNWLPGKKVLISPQWIGSTSWDERKVFVNLSCEAIKLSPEYTEESLLTRDYEIGLYGHYNRKGYWVDELVAD